MFSSPTWLCLCVKSLLVSYTYGTSHPHRWPFMMSPNLSLQPLFSSTFCIGSHQTLPYCLKTLYLKTGEELLSCKLFLVSKIFFWENLYCNYTWFTQHLTQLKCHLSVVAFPFLQGVLIFLGHEFFIISFNHDKIQKENISLIVQIINWDYRILYWGYNWQMSHNCPHSQRAVPHPGSCKLLLQSLAGILNISVSDCLLCSSNWIPSWN